MMDPEKQKVEKKVSQKLGWRVIGGSGNSHRMRKEIKNSYLRENNKIWIRITSEYE